jgi:hypothetical protein
MGGGLVVLANTRPFEGAVFGLGVTIWLLASLAGQKRPAPAVVLRRIAIPLALVLALGGAGMAYYNATVTGHPGMFPYVLYRNTMSVAPHFVWQSLRPAPLYNNRETRGFYLIWEMHYYHLARDGFFSDLAQKAPAYWRFYLGPLLTIPLLAAPFLWRSRQARAALLLAAAFSLALAVEVWHYAHYAAPATGLAILLVTLGMRRLRLWRWRRRAIGLCLVRCLPVGCAALLAVQTIASPEKISGQNLVTMGWRWPPIATARSRILRELTRSSEKHLVFVRYNLVHDSGNEWVYNRADIDASQVVWARELNRASNAALMRRYPDRRVWLVEPDVPDPRPVPYMTAPQRPMPFVAVGAPGIATLRSPGELRRWLRPPAPDLLRNCDVWNFYFTEATGVEGPNVDNACYLSGDRGEPVLFDHWFQWLLSQR